MAYKPSKRGRHVDEKVHANITPMMNLMVVLIPLLLVSAEFVKLGVIELNLPPAALGPEGHMSEILPRENVKKLDLAVTITDRGFIISSSMAVLSGDEEGTPSIPLIPGENDTLLYDFAGVSAKLYEIKQAAGTKFPDVDQIILQAESDILYQILVSTMDAARTVRVNDQELLLFPEVSLSAGIF